MTIDDWYYNAWSKPSDFNEHVPTLRMLASMCDTVVEFGVRRGVSTVALLASDAKTVFSYDLQRTPEVASLEQKAGNTVFRFIQGDSLLVDSPPHDMLFIDTKHTYDQLIQELRKHSPNCKRWIVLHDTTTFGENGEGGGRGLLPAVRDFLKENEDWSILREWSNNNGLMVLGKKSAGHLATIPSGPGTKLKLLLSSVGINPPPECECNVRAAVMDEWGVEKCKAEEATIVGWLKEGATKWGWTSLFTAGLRSLFSGLAFKLNPTDPIPGLVQEAIRLAEKEVVETAMVATPKTEKGGKA